MKTLRKLLVSTIVIVLSVGVLSAQTDPGAFQFLKVVPEAKGIAMAGVVAGKVEGVEAMFWNPAGLAATKKTEVSVSYQNWLIAFNQISAAAALPLGPGVLGAYYNIMLGKTSSVENYAVGAEENNMYMFGNLAYALPLMKILAVSVGVKYAYEKVMDEALNGVLFDAGVRATLLKGKLHAGVVGQNIGYASGELMPAVIKVGVDYTINKGILAITPALGSDIAFDSPIKVGVGAEVGVKEMIFARVGYTIPLSGFELGNLQGISAGLGVKLSIFEVNLAFKSMGYLSQSLLTTIKVTI
jgi:hypothetical protein